MKTPGTPKDPHAVALGRRGGVQRWANAARPRCATCGQLLKTAKAPKAAR